jgi:hypothetical protein
MSFGVRGIAMVIGGLALAVNSVRPAETEPEKGFEPIFNGKDLTGWKHVDRHGDGYRVEKGTLICPKGGGGRLFTQKTYSDFVLRFEFKLEPGSNNGVAIRSPLEGDPAYVGMEIQILDDSSAQYANLRPAQYHGSVYDLFPAKRGALKPPGEWNAEEIYCKGRHVRVTLNGRTIVDANLDDITDPETLKRHPGIKRPEGHIGFLGHGDHVEFRNVRLKDLSNADSTSNAEGNASQGSAKKSRLIRRLFRRD